MRDLDITSWINEINQAMEETEQLIAPLKHLGKHDWAAQLTEETKIMQAAINALQRIGRSKGKRAGLKSMQGRVVRPL